METECRYPGLPAGQARAAMVNSGSETRAALGQKGTLFGVWGVRLDEGIYPWAVGDHLRCSPRAQLLHRAYTIFLDEKNIQVLIIDY